MFRAGAIVLYIGVLALSKSPFKASMPHVHATNNDSTKVISCFEQSQKIACNRLQFCQFSNLEILQVRRGDNSESNELFLYTKPKLVSASLIQTFCRQYNRICINSRKQNRIPLQIYHLKKPICIIATVPKTL